MRNLKTLGLALIAALSLGAMSASTATAQFGFWHLTSDGPVTLIGTQTGEAGSGANALTAFGGKVECPTATYTGHKSETTPHSFIPSGSTSFTVTPHYGKCVALAKPATFDMNGCDYRFYIEATVGPDQYAVQSEIVCPSNKHIQITIFTSESHKVETLFCTLTVTENILGYTGLRATDTTNGQIDVTGKIGSLPNLTVDRSGTGILCPTATTETGQFHLDLALGGKNSAGSATQISISE